MLTSGEILRIYGDQQATFIANGAVDAATALKPAEFVRTDLMQAASK